MHIHHNNNYSLLDYYKNQTIPLCHKSHIFSTWFPPEFTKTPWHYVTFPHIFTRALFYYNKSIMQLQVFIFNFQFCSTDPQMERDSTDLFLLHGPTQNNRSIHTYHFEETYIFHRLITGFHILHRNNVQKDPFVLRNSSDFFLDFRRLRIHGTFYNTRYATNLATAHGGSVTFILSSVTSIFSSASFFTRAESTKVLCAFISPETNSPST